MNLLRAIANLLRFDRTNWKVLALCFLAAGTFWLFNALNKNYATSVRLPLKFEFDGDRFQAVEPLPQHLLINVTGSGWRIIRNEFGLKVPDIIIPLERPADIRRMSAAALLPVVSSQLDGIRLNYIVTDTLFIHIDPVVSKAVRVLVQTEQVSFRKGYGLADASDVSPDTARIKGPESVIAAMGDTLIIRPKLELISSDYHKETIWDGPQKKLISVSPPSFRVHIPVEKIEQFRSIFPLRGIPRGYFISADSVHVTFQIPAAENIELRRRIGAITATVPVPSLKPGESRYTYPVLSTLPEKALVIQLDSVLITRNQP